MRDNFSGQPRSGAGHPQRSWISSSPSRNHSPVRVNQTTGSLKNLRLRELRQAPASSLASDRASVTPLVPRRKTERAAGARRGPGALIGLLESVEIKQGKEVVGAAIASRRMRLNELGGISLMTRSCQEIHCSRLRGLGLWFALVGLLAWPYYFGVPALAEEAESAQLVGAADLMANLEAVEQAFSRIVEQVSPCVVGIRARRYERSSPYERGGYATQNGFEQTVTINGSGVVLRPDGSILTNEHVVRGADEVEIILRDGRAAWDRWWPDPRADLAVVKRTSRMVWCRPGLRNGTMCARSVEYRGRQPFGLGYDGNLSVSVGVISTSTAGCPAWARSRTACTRT